MSELRVRGQEVTIRLTQGSELLTEITAIKNFTMEMRTRILTEQYLGEVSSRQDEIFDEIGGSFTVNPEGTQILELQRFVYDRARRRVFNEEQVSATFRTLFPVNGGTPVRMTIPDMKFDPIPYTVGNRDAYVEMAFSYKASSYLINI